MTASDSSTDAETTVRLLERKLARERAARQTAEALLEGKSRELYEQNRALAATNRELEQFAYVASHDLKAPLRNIQAFAQLLGRSEQPTLSEDGQEFLQIIHDCSSQMQALIDDLLMYSRAQRTEIPDEIVSLDDAMDAVKDRLTTDISDADATLTVTPLPLVRGHAGQLSQLLQNLVANGIKFARPDTPPAIHVFAEAPRSGAHRIVFQDNGIGIAAEHHERVFDMFKRLHADSEYEGTGIGLALCRKIAVRHGGDIALEPSDQAGARFVVTLPVVSGA